MQYILGILKHEKEKNNITLKTTRRLNLLCGRPVILAQPLKVSLLLLVLRDKVRLFLVLELGDQPGGVLAVQLVEDHLVEDHQQV